MAWIESHQELKDHPKLMRLARALGIHRAQAIGHLHALWWWALDYAPDGDLSDYDPEDIAEAALWDGDAQQFVDALVSCGPGSSAGFLEREGTRLLLHDWCQYGNQHKVRQQAAERKRRSRERAHDSHTRVTPVQINDGEMSRDRHVTVTGPERDRHATVTPDKTRPDQTRQDQRDIHVGPPGPPAESGPSPPGFDETSVPYQLALHLREAILQRDPSTKVPDPNPRSLARWALEADRMVRIDGREPEEAARLIEWCQQDPFWCANILSMSTFRRQYDRLKRQAQRAPNGSRPPPGDTPLHRRLRARGVIA